MGFIISASFFVPPFILFCTVPLNYSPFLLTIMFFISFSAPDFNNSVTLCLTPPPSHLTPQQGEGPSSDRLRAGPGPQRQAGPGQQWHPDQRQPSCRCGSGQTPGQTSLQLGRLQEVGCSASPQQEVSCCIQPQGSISLHLQHFGSTKRLLMELLVQTNNNDDDV